MYCRECRLEFSGTYTDERCPNCGRPAEAISADPAQTDLGRYALEVPEDELVPASETRTESPAAKTQSLERGNIVAGKYEIIRKIGSGGFGSVFKVRHIQRKKLYALKTPHSEYLRDETFQKRFEREIEAMERFVHPDMVVVRDSGVTESGLSYYTMDFIDGESLRSVMAREGAFEIKRALNIIRRVLEVLDAAHRHQIIHRDIKPDNILLTKNSGREVVKVLDFGVAKLLDTLGNTGTITRGVRVGTPKYMSPEQVTGDAVDGRSDLFAVGILLYEMLVGVHPFAVDRNPIRTTAAIISKEPEPPRKLRAEIPRSLSDKVMSMLEKKPRRRPQSAADALEGLPNDVSGRARFSAPACELVLFPDTLRQRLTSIVLSRETPRGVERFFLFFKTSVSIGRSNDEERGIFNDLLLRRLPCRSAQEDADNWNLNLTISHRVAQLHIDKTAVVIEPFPEARSGIAVSGLRSREAVRIQSDRFYLSMGERALDLDGYRALKDSSREPVDLSCVPVLDEGAEDVPRGIGYSDPDCLVNCVRLTRSGNYSLHSYYVVTRRLAIGSGASTELRLEGEDGVKGHHASLIFDRGELFFIPVGGEVRVYGLEGGGAQSATLNPGTVLPVIPGLTLALGSVLLRADRVTEQMFKRV